eukprot:12424990-Karenia_brevis.AAC.1
MSLSEEVLMLMTEDLRASSLAIRISSIIFCKSGANNNLHRKRFCSSWGTLCNDAPRTASSSALSLPHLSAHVDTPDETSSHVAWPLTFEISTSPRPLL